MNVQKLAKIVGWVFILIGVLGFVPGVTNQIKFVRGLYEFMDLENSTNPFNFVQGISSDGFSITVIT